MRNTVAVLAHGLLAVGLVGEVLTIAFTAPHDAQALTVRLPDALLAVLTVLSGWMLAWKRPGLPIGWLLLSVGVINAPAGPAYAAALAWRHGDQVAAGWAYTFGFESQWTWIPGLGMLVVILPLFFPTGHLPSPRWRWVAWSAAVALALATGVAATMKSTFDIGVPNPVHLPYPGGEAIAGPVVLLLLATAALGSLSSVVVRYRGADPIERAQLRWLFWAVAIIVGWLVLENVENVVFGDERSGGVSAFVAYVLDFIAGLTYSLVPLAIMIGVLRYGLYAIDRIISRTAAYSVVTVTVVGSYLAVVLMLSLLLPNAPVLGVAVPTLAAAGVFLPLLRFTRRVVDRRFNRAQYDAETVVEMFGERIRNGADPHGAGADLLDAVDRTLQPSAVGIWVAPEHS